MLNLNCLVLGEVVAVDHLAAESLRGFLLEGLADEELVADLLEPLILEMMAEVKKFYDAVLKAHDDVPVEGYYACLILLELNVVLAALCREVNVRYLSCTKRLQLIAHHVEPDELHLYLRIVCRFPNDDLAALVQRQKYRGAKILRAVLPLVMLQLYEVYKITVYLAEVKQLLLSSSPF